MSTTHTPIQPSPSPIHWTSLFQLVFSALAALLLLGVATLIAVTSIVQFFTQGSGSLDITQSFMIAASLAFVGILVLPSAWHAWKNFSAPGSERFFRQAPPGFGLILTFLVLVVVPGSLWLGNLVSQNDQLAWLLLPLLNIIVNGLSAVWLIYIAVRGLRPGTPRHMWGIFASGLVVSPAIILTLELLALAGFGVLVILWAMQNPGISSQLRGLLFHLQYGSPNRDVILRILSPYLFQPGILLIGFSFISVLVPLIEEALKPIGVWFLARQNLNPAQGFAYGVLSGAGFGLFENLGNTSVSGESWAILASTRITTLLLHCLTTGMLGWALVSAWGEKRYLRLAAIYAFAVIVHGLWNGMAVLTAVTSLEDQAFIKIPANLLQIGKFAPIGVITLGLFNLLLYLGFNAFFRNSRFIKTSLLPAGGVPTDLPVNVSSPSDSFEATKPNTGTSSSLSHNETEFTIRDQPQFPDNDHPSANMD